MLRAGLPYCFGHLAAAAEAQSQTAHWTLTLSRHQESKRKAQGHGKSAGAFRTARRIRVASSRRKAIQEAPVLPSKPSSPSSRWNSSSFQVDNDARRQKNTKDRCQVVASSSGNHVSEASAMAGFGDHLRLRDLGKCCTGCMPPLHITLRMMRVQTTVRVSAGCGHPTPQHVHLPSSLAFAGYEPFRSVAEGVFTIERHTKGLERRHSLA